MYSGCALNEQPSGRQTALSAKSTDFEIPDDPAVFLLHVSTMSTKTYKKTVLRHLLNGAQAYIPLLWKQQTPTTIALWLRKVEDMNWMEDLMLAANDRHEIKGPHIKKRGPFGICSSTQKRASPYLGPAHHHRIRLCEALHTGHENGQYLTPAANSLSLPPPPFQFPYLLFFFCVFSCFLFFFIV